MDTLQPPPKLTAYTELHGRTQASIQRAVKKLAKGEDKADVTERFIEDLEAVGDDGMEILKLVARYTREGELEPGLYAGLLKRMAREDD